MEGYPSKPGENSKSSVFGSVNAQVIGNMLILPVRDTIRGTGGPEFDIVDEVLYHIRTNIFMRDIPVRTAADRDLVYLTFYGMKCLKLFGQKTMTKQKAQQEIDGWNVKAFPLPGDAGFVIPQLVSTPKPDEKPALQDFLKKARNELGHRLLEVVFKEGKADKWWICFSNKKFLNEEMKD